MIANSLFSLFLMLLILTFPVGGLSLIYDPPIGIPAPDFGIEETVEGIYGAGYYTHYIDNAHSNATDVNNPFGTASKPRKTIPTNLYPGEGSVVEIHGGPYTIGAMAWWTARGSKEKPVFIRGADPNHKVRITKTELQIGGRYLILENLELYNKSHIYIGNGSVSHVAVRNCEIHNPQGSLTDFGSAIYAKGEDVVVYNNHIHHNWQGDDVDCHGVVPGQGAHRVWVLDNHIHHNSGDAVQACHACDPAPQFVYVGRNIMHDDRENGVDLKYVKDIVISQNVLYGYEDASTSDGSAMVLGSDGAPNRPWVIFNEIYDSANGIRNEATDRAWIIGNKIYNIKGFAIGLEKKSDDLYIIGNTIYDVGVTIDQFWRDTFRLHVFNNIFADINKSTVHLNIESEKIIAASEMSHNLFWQDGEPVIIKWGSGKSYHSTSDFDGFSGGTNNMVGDPLFKDTVNHNFELQPNSPAIDAGIAHAAYDTFFEIYGIGIKCDFAGNDRPRQLNWDIGAYEYGEDTGILNEQMNTPINFGLQNYPNPFNPTTTIQFEIPKRSKVKLEISNIIGQKIITLVDNHYNAGNYAIDWNGKDQNNRKIFSGMYFCRIITDEQVLSKKMSLIR